MSGGCIGTAGQARDSTAQADAKEVLLQPRQQLGQLSLLQPQSTEAASQRLHEEQQQHTALQQQQEASRSTGMGDGSTASLQHTAYSIASKRFAGKM